MRITGCVAWAERPVTGMLISSQSTQLVEWVAVQAYCTGYRLKQRGSLGCPRRINPTLTSGQPPIQRR